MKNVKAKILLGVILLISVSVAKAQDVHGVLRVVKGDVQIKSAKTGQLAHARIGEQVFPKDVVLTGKDARAKIVMVDNNEINVSPESQIEIQHYEFDPSQGKKDVLLNVIYGKVRAKVEQKYDGKTSKFQVKTPSAVAGVRGTDFMTSYSQSNNSSQVVTFRGAVEFGLPGPGGTITNSVSVTPGTQASTNGGGKPGAPTSVPKDQLAKMDNDSKADGTGGGKSDRQPSNSGGQKGNSNSNGNSGGNGASGNNGSGNGGPGNSASGNGGSGGNAALTQGNGGAGAPPPPGPSATNSDNGGGPSTTGNSDPGRSPASAPGPSASAPPPPTSMLQPSDIVTGPNSNNVPSNLPTGPVIPVIPVAQPTTVIQPCTLCNQLIQTGSHNLTVNIH